MKRLLTKYRNGNYNVMLFEDGTKIRYNDEDKLIPEFVESLDMKISNYCPFLCPECHEQSTPEGEYGKILNHPFLNELHKGIEVALGGGAVTYHPDLIPFLEDLKKRQIFANITINQQEWEQTKIQYLIDNKLIYGLGVSFNSFDDEIWNEILEYPNTVVHLIAGFHDKSVFEYFANKGAKILILGFKTWGRGEDYFYKNKDKIKENIFELKDFLPTLFTKCKVVSFDNLALSQLDVQKIVSEEKWKESYMGNDGEYTMYVDLVKNECAISSTSAERFPIEEFQKVWEKTKLKEE